jgi:hypothetical protein
MSRLPGTPGPLRWVRYAIGFRLPAENSDWVRHDLVDAGWRVRAGVRQVVVAAPIAAVCTLVPGPWSVRLPLVALVFFGTLSVALAYGDSIRAARLRQHELPVPDDADLGRPTDS